MGERTPPCHFHGPGASTLSTLSPNVVIAGGDALQSILSTLSEWHGRQYETPFGAAIARSHLNWPGSSGPIKPTAPVAGSIRSTRFACPGTP